MNPKSTILLTVGNNVRRYRKQLNISQEELAYRAGLHRTYIGMIERAEKNITLINLEKIAIALGIQVEALIKNQS